MAILQMVRGPEPGKRFEIQSERAVLGRHPECDLRFDVAAISRQHAAVTRQEDRYFVEDLGSRNGTYVNGRRLTKPSALASGDRIVICDLTFDFFPSSEAEKLAGPNPGDESSFAFMLQDDPDDHSSTNVMSKLDVSTDYASIRLTARPETKLAALIEISKSLSRALSLDEILPRLLESLFKIFVQADRGFVILREPQTNKLIPRAIRSRNEDDQGVVRISRTIVNQAIEQKEAILSADASSDQRFDMAQSVSDFSIRSMMCAPIVDLEGTAIGVLQVDTLNQRSRFTEHDLEVLAGVASQAAIAMDNAQMHEKIWAQRSLERDLELARRVQHGIVPATPPQVSGYRFFHYYEPANMVGGDCYDYVPLSGGRCAVVTGDVAGKGVSAALLMAKLSGEVRYHLASETDLAVAVNRINQAFARSDWQDRFVTFAVALVDPSEHRLTLVNAGHMPPVLRHRDGRVEEIGEKESGLPLGVLESFQYQTHTREIAPGDFLLIYTDGISEAMNDRRELYGQERILQQASARLSSVEELGQHLLDSVRDFVGGEPQSDDMCLICFGREGAA